jgi:hypothetical protein
MQFVCFVFLGAISMSCSFVTYVFVNIILLEIHVFRAFGVGVLAAAVC